MSWIVVMPSVRIAYPIARRETAHDFAAYLRDEVDPAEVRAEAEGLPEGYDLRDPVRELLTWRECVALPQMGGERR